MTDLIPIFQNNFAGETVNTVNATQLHTFLEVGTKFSDWIKKRIEQYDFKENQDYVVVKFKPNQNEASIELNDKSTVLNSRISNNKPNYEYFVTLDMAKELSMVERNAKGKQARQYFIACEKKALAPQKELSRKELALLVIEAEAELEKTKLELHEQKTINETFIATAENIPLRNAGKLLKQKPQKFIDSLKGIYLFYEGGCLVPYIRFIQQGIFTVKENFVEIKGVTKMRLQTLITPKGINYFANKLKEA